jgi:hypothetical protein
MSRRQGSPCRRHGAAWARLYPPPGLHRVGDTVPAPGRGPPLVYIEGSLTPLASCRRHGARTHGVLQRRGAHQRSSVGQSRGDAVHVVHVALAAGAQRGGSARQARVGAPPRSQGDAAAAGRARAPRTPQKRPAPEARTLMPRVTRVSGALHACAGTSASRRVTTPAVPTRPLHRRAAAHPTHGATKATPSAPETRRQCAARRPRAPSVARSPPRHRAPRS